MADTTLNVRLNYEAGGNATAQTRAMAQSAQQIAASERQMVRDLATRRQEQERLGRLVEAELKARRAMDPNFERNQVKEMANKRQEQERLNKAVEKELELRKGLAGKLAKVGRGLAYGAAGFAAVGAVANYAAQAGARYYGAANDPTLSDYQRSRGMAESLPIIGGLVKSLTDFGNAVSGATGRLKGMRQAVELQNARQQASDTAAGKFQGLRFQTIAAVARADAAARADRVGFAGVDVSTVQGERARLSAERRLPLEVAARSAGINVKASKTEASRLDTEILRAENDIESAKNAQAAARARQAQGSAEVKAALGRTIPQLGEAAGGERKREQGLHQEVTAINAELAARERLQTALAKRQETAVQLAQAESQQRKALLALDQERLQTLTETENRVKGAAQSYGALTAGEKLAALQSARQLNEQGYASLSEDQRAILSRAGGGERLAKEAENFALQDKGFAELQAQLGERSDLRNIQQERAKAQAKVAVSIQLDESKLASDLEKALSRLLDKITENIKKTAEAQGLKARREQGARNAAQ